MTRGQGVYAAAGQSLPHHPKPFDSQASCSLGRVARSQSHQIGTDGCFCGSQEAWALLSVVGLYGAGTALAWSQPIVATVLLGLGMQQAGWLAHDYVHGRGAWCTGMRWFGSLTNGHSASWWSQKHSLHHTFTNEEMHDNDIMMEPLLFLRPPAVSGGPAVASRAALAHAASMRRTRASSIDASYAKHDASYAHAWH